MQQSFRRARHVRHVRLPTTKGGGRSERVERALRAFLARGCGGKSAQCGAGTRRSQYDLNRAGGCGACPPPLA